MIRTCRPGDLAAVVDIANRAWRPINAAYRAAYGDELFNLLFPGIVGFCNYWFDEEKKIGTIGYNAVDPDCGLKGIGQAMYKAVLEEFRKRGMCYANVHTGLDEGHAPARRAYKRAGFDISHGTVDYYMKLRETE